VSGIQEILVLLIIIFVVFLMPRVMGGGREKKEFSFKRVSGKMRAAMAVSLFYVAIWTLILEPWHHQRLLFVSVGLGPVAFGWTVWWVVEGFPGRKKKQD